MEHISIIESSISDVKKLVENNNSSAYSNVADQFLPIGPQTLKDHKLDWDRVYQSLIEDLFQLSLGERDREQLKEEVLESFRNSRDTRELVDVFDELYLSTNAINNITPLAYLVSNKETLTSRTKTMIKIVQGLLISPLSEKLISSGNNPLESLLIEKIQQLCKTKTFNEGSITYLPFLAEAFSKDIKTLTKNPSYFLSELEGFINIYTFLYLTQLTKHLCIPSNRYTTPTAKPLYFILETERASKERHECNQYGYDHLFSKTNGIALYLFPYLGYFSQLSQEPSWKLINSSDFFPKVNQLNQCIGQLFDEGYRHEDSLQAAVNSGLNLQKQIFEKTSRKDANKKVVEIFEKKFAAEFITDRKAAGKYFVLNSNMLLLLTNLIISGSLESQLLIDDVIEGFKERGIWLDIMSKKALLKFYENVGNIEKLSDSGDAVYVKTTI
ncbi:DNA phosphorothioation-dependent restriction protein DptG [Marinomonas pontica]|uniref:DNA phosphorothioation-dependent restriction protein DptG n=1 Tax=Marinomonas pontica TaxID=264739 RepID=UPI002242E678|nr:DNA phosphorothioation-dependent restriction protein DptG [Marinomonas pontica]MCW8356852.1 DNA phosphorothioation-dependent restriction protein DptG [Marinomonas pontica]